MTTPAIEAICQDLCGFLSENVLAEGVSIDACTSLSDVGVDSFSLIEIILYIERKFGVILLESDFTPENLASVQTLAQCLRHRLIDA